MLIFFWLESVELAKDRVKSRVEKGGHNIPSDTIERRYERGLDNFFNLYKNLVDEWYIHNNSYEIPLLIAQGKSTLDIIIHNSEIWKKLQSAHENI